MLDTLTRKYRSWQKYRQTIGELSQLSGRELRDLGMARSDIEFVARKAAR